jgi:non-homologous end joining protein Ku
MLMAIVKEKKAAVESNAKLQKENGKVDRMVDLMEKWRRACEAMGSKIKVVHACSDLNNSWKGRS